MAPLDESGAAGAEDRTGSVPVLVQGGFVRLEFTVETSKACEKRADEGIQLRQLDGSNPNTGFLFHVIKDRTPDTMSVLSQAIRCGSFNRFFVAFIDLFCKKTNLVFGIFSSFCAAFKPESST